MTSTNVQTQRDITCYVLGQRMPNEAVRPEIKDKILTTVQTKLPNLAPTTYEAAKAYLDQEVLKQEGERDLTREMCMLVVMKIPDDQDIVFGAAIIKTQICLRAGDVLFYPTVELPPTAFGTVENPESAMLLDRKTSTLGRAIILLTYFTKVGPDVLVDDGTKVTQLDYAPLD